MLFLIVDYAYGCQPILLSIFSLGFDWLDRYITYVHGN